MGSVLVRSVEGEVTAIEAVEGYDRVKIFVHWSDEASDGIVIEIPATGKFRLRQKVVLEIREDSAD